MTDSIVGLPSYSLPTIACTYNYNGSSSGQSMNARSSVAIIPRPQMSVAGPCAIPYSNSGANVLPSTKKL